MRAAGAALRRVAAATRRAEAARARLDTRAWVVERRERTHHLIELGGLVQKAGLDGLVDDDRAVLLGALLSLTDQLAGEDRADVLALWRRRGKRAFAADEAAG
ncbi:MAG: conjugal transfer protein TraD [Phenylobacterium sp.]|nr:MAG: conjugal transfer protein TraD [Phenylobacterium sp.]